MTTQYSDPVEFVRCKMIKTRKDTERFITEVWQYENPESLFEETGITQKELLGLWDIEEKNGDFIVTTTLSPFKSSIEIQFPVLLHDRISIESVDAIIDGDGHVWIHAGLMEEIFS